MGGQPREALQVLVGMCGGLLRVYGLLFGIGHAIFGRRGPTLIALGAVVAGVRLVRWVLATLEFDVEESGAA